MYRVCALFSPRISLPSLYRYYLHKFPISHNCLAPPHFPESPHRAFIPQCIYSPHCAFVPCEFLLSTIYLLTIYLLYSCFIPTFFSLDICYSSVLYLFMLPVSCFLFRSSLFPVSLPMSSKSCVYIFHRSMSVSLFSFDFVAPPPSVCFIPVYCLCLVFLFCLS